MTRIIGLEVTDPVHIASAATALGNNFDKIPMVNRASGRAGLLSKRLMQRYDEGTVTLMCKVVRPTGTPYLEETKFEESAWETIDQSEFIRL